MSEKNRPIPSIKIKQILWLIVITAMVCLIVSHLTMFIPSLLGAVTLYVVFRKLNFYLIEQKNWNRMLSSVVIILISLVVLILPIYWIADLVIEKLGDSKEYMGKFSGFLDKIHTFVQAEVGVDILSKENLDKVKEATAQLSTSLLSGTFNTVSVIISMFFMLYFMLEKPRKFERLVTSAVPLKRANTSLIADKFRKLVMANAVGIPVVAIGQGLVALVGYLICGAPSPVLLFALTAVTSMIPIVGAGIVFVPVCLFMIAEGDTGWGIGLLLYCLIIVGTTDNILRFTLLKKLEDIHPLNTVFGIIMGMNLFGFMGLVFGPILVSMTVLLIQVYRNEFGDSDNNGNNLIMPEEELKNKLDLKI